MGGVHYEGQCVTDSEGENSGAEKTQSLRSCLPHAAANESILSSHYAQIINTQRQSFLLNIHPQSGKRERIAPEG